jgi:ribosomal protein L40E
MFGIGMPELVILLVIFIILAAIVIGVILLIRRSTERSAQKPHSIFCTQCGTQNDANASHCARCGVSLLRPQPSGISAGVEVPNYLAQAILVTIFCCVPLGIPAIIFAAQVNGKLAAGDYAGAVETSRKAKLWCWISFGVYLGIALIYFAVVIIGILGGRRYY